MSSMEASSTNDATGALPLPLDDVDDLRQRGNFEFAAGHYDHALSLYTAALEQLSTTTKTTMTDLRVLLLCNRSACFFQMEDYEQSASEAWEAWQESSERSVKAAFRFVKTVLKLSPSLSSFETMAITTAHTTDPDKPPAPVMRMDQAKQVLQKAMRVLDEQEQEQDHHHQQQQQQQQQQQPVSQIETTATNDTKSTLSGSDSHPAPPPVPGPGVVPPPTIASQRKVLQDLWHQILNTALSTKDCDNDVDNQHQQRPETSIRYVKRPVSIKEFERGKELGFGNFSDLYVVKHKATGEHFALKVIEKKKAADLAKRQHPNVYNEIQMERRVLLERLPTHPFIIRMYHAFQDYYSLYYSMELHTAWSDLWSELQYLPKYQIQHDSTNRIRHMVGCHRSQAVVWLDQVLDAVEHMHRHGIVHRDLKTENVLLDAHGHVVIIDFGTAKDLIQTDLNGPEFVGTPDFMSPEAVAGTSTEEETRAAEARGDMGSNHASDLWAVGAMAFIMQTGHTPFWCPSQYLAFLKIKRCILRRPIGIVDDDAWDLIQRLMHRNPLERLGADAFDVVEESVANDDGGDRNKSNRDSDSPKQDSEDSVKSNPSNNVPNASLANENKRKNRQRQRRIVERNPHGYEAIRNHPYFAVCRQDESIKYQTPVPTLRDLCIRAVAELAYQDSLDIELCDRHPPGDGSSHDLMRLEKRERAAVMHLLDRLKLFRDHPRLYARFFGTVTESRLDKIRPSTQDVVGLTQMNDDQGKPPHAMMNDPYAKPIPTDPIQIVHLINPLFCVCDIHSINEEIRKTWIKLLKKCIAAINRSRPKLVVVTAVTKITDDKIRKLLARVNETIPVVLHEGSAYFTFWIMGVQCIALQSTDEAITEESSQVVWLREQLEQCRMSKHPLFCFVNDDPRQLPLVLQKQLARGRVLALFGLVVDRTHVPLTRGGDEMVPITSSFQSQVTYKANEVVGDDNVSIRSSDSDEDDDRDTFTMKIDGTAENGLRWISIDAKPDSWTSTFEAFEST